MLCIICIALNTVSAQKKITLIKFSLQLSGNIDTLETVRLLPCMQIVKHVVSLERQPWSDIPQLTMAEYTAVDHGRMYHGHDYFDHGQM